MNVPTGSPRSDRSMENENVYKTHPNLYKILPLKAQKHLDTLRKKISAMVCRKSRESLAQPMAPNDIYVFSRCIPLASADAEVTEGKKTI